MGSGEGEEFLGRNLADRVGRLLERPELGGRRELAIEVLDGPVQRVDQLHRSTLMGVATHPT